MSNFNEFLAEQMKDPEFKAEWDALDPEFTVIEAILKARKESGLTQKQLSERTGIAQTDISKLERGQRKPFAPYSPAPCSGNGNENKTGVCSCVSKVNMVSPSSPHPGAAFCFVSSSGSPRR